eukprot:TRINITY_DN3328_c2_g3_i1.p2 TRINITY_DN3328_c2_g3~~TRINITY_DN3328_c2_g3_i1.p2  ORF type:complete len:491 (+),score=172.24 TRINITY_DN3328_c2_g3_i1:37-1509(+)
MLGRVAQGDGLPMHSRGARSGSGMHMSISQVPNMDEQLRLLRESVRKGREQKGSAAGGNAAGRWGGDASRGGGAELKKKSSLRNRLPGGDVASPMKAGGRQAQAPPRPQSRQVTETIERIAAFDLFGGAVDANALGADDGDSKAAYGDVDVAQLQKTYQEEFKEIDNYRYDEDQEKRIFMSRNQPPPGAAPPARKPSAAGGYAGGAPRLSGSPPKQPTPPRASTRRASNTTTSPARTSHASARAPDVQGTAKRDLWGAYELDAPARPGQTLNQFKKSKRTGKPLAASVTTTTPHRAKAVPAAAAVPKDSATAARVAELTKFLCTPPPTGGDVEGHQLAQRRALEELQRLQGGGTPASSAAPTPTASSASTVDGRPQKTVRIVRTSDASEVHGGGGGGGALLQGDFNEAQNQREFQDALQEWRTGGKKKAAASAASAAAAVPATASAAVGDTAPLPPSQRDPFAHLKEEFLNGLEEQGQYVYFHHLMFQGP